jgi:hypothetical protein
MRTDRLCSQAVFRLFYADRRTCHFETSCGVAVINAGHAATIVGIALLESRAFGESTLDKVNIVWDRGTRFWKVKMSNEVKVYCMK